jgi:hypothetical protein
MIEMNCLQVIQALTSKKDANSELTVKFSKALLSSNNYLEISFIWRQPSRVAHSLARASHLCAGLTIFCFVPPYIETLIINEIQ